jgi:2-polyprenyl-3-methyl-5-hydroxy-6-metoxy-1,4-benzoquinol methylase
MNAEPWQLKLVRRSLKKKEKLRLLETTLPFLPSRVALDLGCAQGILSYFARQKGGFWVSADADMVNLKSAKEILQSNLVQLQGEALPFKSQSYDLVLCLDYLEHIENDDLALEEIARVLKIGGQTILVTPHTGDFFLLHKLRSALGLKLDYFGHKREGYAARQLEEKLCRAHLTLEKKVTYSRFFSEFFELILNLVYIKILVPKPAETKRDGHIRPSSLEEFNAQKKPFALYTFLYPFIWLVSQLDTLLFFEKGYSLMVWAKKI